MNTNYKLIKTLNNHDFEQLILQKDRLVGHLYELEEDIREQSSIASKDEFTVLMRAYSQKLIQLSLLCEYMSQHSPELAKEWGFPA